MELNFKCFPIEWLFKYPALNRNPSLRCRRELTQHEIALLKHTILEMNLSGLKPAKGAARAFPISNVPSGNLSANFHCFKLLHCGLSQCCFQ